jgi:hypothetical protein
MDVQARGSVHEAFGEPTRAAPITGAVVPKAPPPRIEEAPPEQRPEGDNIVWIPGYWAFDNEAADFMWISGFWRAVPPGRNWVPGSWQATTGGYHWVGGYWGVAEASGEAEYLPVPPETIDRGPSIPAPAEGYNYVPGCWVYQTVRYVWRPGYWIAHRPGWCWTPACYRWTPCGYVFISGYWDLPLFDRGLLFAPVVFTRPLWLRPGFFYRPSFCIQPDFLCGALFVRPRCGCYFFGDFFAAGYRRDFVPWIDYRFARVNIDVNFGYYRHNFARHGGWETGLGALYAGRYRGDIGRPPRTLVQQNTVINNITTNKITNVVVNKNVNITNIQNVSVLAPVNKVKNINVTGLSALAGPGAAPASREVRLAKVSATELDAEKKSIERFRAISRERRNNESALVAKAPAAAIKAPVKVKLELPKDTPPAKVIKNTLTPPTSPKSEIKPIVDTKPIKIEKPVTNPPTTTPMGTKPPVTKPAEKPPVTNPPMGTTPPMGTKPPMTKPPEKPPVTNPPTTPPMGTKPPMTKPAEKPPVVVPPMGTKPPITNPPPAVKPMTPPPTTPPPTTPMNPPPSTKPPVTNPPPAVKPMTPPPPPAVKPMTTTPMNPPPSTKPPVTTTPAKKP